MKRHRILVVSYFSLCLISLLWGMRADQTANAALDKGDAAAALLGGAFPMLLLTSPTSWLIVLLAPIIGGSTPFHSFLNYAGMAFLGYVQWFIVVPKIFRFVGSLVRRRAS